MNLATVLVIGAVDGQGMRQSPGYSVPAEKKAKKVDKENNFKGQVVLRQAC